MKEFVDIDWDVTSTPETLKMTMGCIVDSVLLWIKFDLEIGHAIVFDWTRDNKDFRKLYSYIVPWLQHRYMI